MLLAVDTATSLAGLALYDCERGEVVAELVWRAGRSHSTQLLSQLDRLLNLAGVAREQLTAFAATIGPGSYTGLRVGLAAVQGLAFALGRPAIGVNALDVLAEAQPACTPLPIRPVLEAGRGRVATALYRQRDHRWARDEAVRGASLDELLDLVCEPVLVCGDLSAEARRRLTAERPQAILATPAQSLRRPSLAAELAWRALLAGDRGDPRILEPVYLSRA